MAVQLLQKQSIEQSERIDDDVYYPSADGEPMGETGIHVRAIAYLYYALRILFGAREDVYVAADMFLYYQRGNPRAVKAPDVMLVKGVQGNHERDSFKVWVEGCVPAVIFEITSPSTWSEDPGVKKQVYERLGVQEYFIFDPLQELLTTSLLGFRLMNGQYTPIVANSDGSLTVQEIGCRVWREGSLLRMSDPLTGETILWEHEVIAKLQAAQERAEQEAQRAEQEAQRAEQEAQRAEQEAQRAEQEAQRATAAEAENALLRTLLQQLQDRESDESTG
jgi:Uma2 family endonuclease